MSASPAQDPFGAASGAGTYVPRRATEEALERLVRTVLQEARPAVILGPGGIGKTVLLRRLVEVASQGFRPLYLPFAALSPEEFGHWILSALGLGHSEDPFEALRAQLAEQVESGAPLLLLVDDATALPLETARWLGDLCRAGAGALRVALAALETPATSGLIAALGSELEVVPLTSPMSREETRAYLTARLARASTPKSRRAVVDATFERLHLVARGNPRRLHFAADAVMRGEAPESIDSVLGDEEAARAPRRSSLSTLIRPSAPNRAGTFRFAHEALRPPKDAEAPEPAPAAGSPPAAREEAGPKQVHAASPVEGERREAGPGEPSAPAGEGAVEAARADAPAAEEASSPGTAGQPVGAMAPAATEAPPETELRPADAGNASYFAGARAFLAGFLRQGGEAAGPGSAPAAATGPAPAPAGVAAEPLAAEPETEELPWAKQRPTPAAPWHGTLGRRVARAIRLTASRARQAPSAYAARRRLASAGDTRFLGHVRVREPRAPTPWRSGLERLAASCVALALLGLAIVYLTPLLADWSRGFLTRGISTAGDGFDWIVRVIEEDFSSAREVAIGDFSSADELVRERLSAAAEALLQVPERLLEPSDPDVAAAPGRLPQPTLARPPAPPRGAATDAGAAQFRAETAPSRSLLGSPLVVRVGINASPWARISVDGVPIGETPIAAFPLLAGSYRFTATFPDGSQVERRVEVGPETRSIVFP